MEVDIVRPDVDKWGQTLADLRQLATDAEHPRTRERFLALYVIGSKQSNAARWSVEIGRTDETVLGWVHTYNAGGPEAMTYRRTGGRRPLFRKSKQQALPKR